MTANNETPNSEPSPTWFMETEVAGLMKRSYRTSGKRYASSVKTVEIMRDYLTHLEGEEHTVSGMLKWATIGGFQLIKESIVVRNRWSLNFEVRATLSYGAGPGNRQTFICTFTPEDANIVPGEALFDDLAESIQNCIAITAAEVLRMTVYLSH